MAWDDNQTDEDSIDKDEWNNMRDYIKSVISSKNTVDADKIYIADDGSIYGAGASDTHRIWFHGDNIIRLEANGKAVAETHKSYLMDNPLQFLVNQARDAGIDFGVRSNADGLDGYSVYVDGDTGYVGLGVINDLDADTIDAQLHLGGGVIKNRSSLKTTNYTTAVGDYLIPVDTSGGAVTITLGSAQVHDGQELLIKDEGGSAGSNNITIDTEGAETIDGVSSINLTVDYDKIRLYSDGTNWFTI